MRRILFPLFAFMLGAGVANATVVGDDTAAEQSGSPKDFVVTVDGVSFKMIWVEGGTFWMGSNDLNSEEKPVHKVTLDGYWIAETEVTQLLWITVMEKDEGWNSEVGRGANYPAYFVSYDEAVAFCKKLNEKTGGKYNFTLPTEAQWEYAARGGNRVNSDPFAASNKYSGSNTVGDVAWSLHNSGEKTHPVKGKKANELGLYDMSGNICEWCLDWYGKSYYSNSPSKNPKGPSSGSYRVLRGGCWYSIERLCRVANRGVNDFGLNCAYCGFRVAISSGL